MANTATSNVTPPGLQDWLNSDNTADVMHNLGVVYARLSSVLAEILNLQKDIVSEVSERIKKISELMNEIRSIRFAAPTDTNPNPSAPLGRTKEDSLRILRAMKAFGIPNLDADIAAAEKASGPLTVGKIWADSMIPSLQGVSESESNRSNQEGLRLQTFTSRYTQSGEQSSTAQQKKGQSVGTVINNMRIAG